MMNGYGYYDNMMGGTSGAAGILMFAFWLLVIAGIGLLIVWAVRSMSGTHHQSTPPADDACSIARARYARGEITKEEFDEMCKRLGM